MPAAPISPQTNQPRKRGFPPVTNAGTRVLILGSLPGEQSLVRQEYYGNPQNAFWRLMSGVTGIDLVPRAYEARLEALLGCGVGLWDVVAEAHRPGSLDSAIRARDDNDLASLLSTLPQLNTIAFNGGTAARLGLKVLGALADRYRILTLPSSSPAHTLAFADKLLKWQHLTAALERATPLTAAYD